MNSLLQQLPSIESLIGAGIVAVLLTQLLTTGREIWKDRRERKREKENRNRERNGLLRILNSEVSSNGELLELIASSKQGGNPVSFVGTGISRDLHNEAWVDVRVKLSPYLESKEFATIASYYSNLLALKEKLDFAKQLDLTPGVSRELHDRGKKIQKIILEYVPDATTDNITAADVLQINR